MRRQRGPSERAGTLPAVGTDRLVRSGRFRGAHPPSLGQVAREPVPNPTIPGAQHGQPHRAA